MSRDDYREVEVLRDSDGVVCVITVRQSPDGVQHHAYALLKEYERDGKVFRTSFMNRRHAPAVRRLLLKVEEWLDQAADRVTSARARRPSAPILTK